MRMFKHRKTGGYYMVAAEGRMQSKDWRSYDEATDDLNLVDMEEVVIYMSMSDGEFWVRPKAEFYDGRFEEIENIKEKENE